MTQTNTPSSLHIPSALALPLFKVVPLSLDTANSIRSRRQDDFGNKVIETLATGKGPCRVSLRPFKIGKDRRFLFKHSPFEIDNIFNQPGPIFINKANVEPYTDVNRFPPTLIADQDIPITLIGYSSEQVMIYTRQLSQQEKENIDTLITEIFNQHINIAFLHARHAEACCYICKIEPIRR